MYSRFSAAVRFQRPLSKPDLEGLPADHAFECRDLCFVLLKKIGRAGILIKGPSLKLLDPDSDQVA